MRLMMASRSMVLAVDLACAPRRAADASGLAEARVEPAAMVLDLAMRFVPRLRSAGSGRRFDQVRASERMSRAYIWLV
jgi:hypothetical protein